MAESGFQNTVSQPFTIIFRNMLTTFGMVVFRGRKDFSIKSRSSAGGFGPGPL